MEAPYFRIIAGSLLKRVRAWLGGVNENPSLLDDEDAALDGDFEALTAIHEMFMKSCLMGMDAAAAGRKRRSGNFADPAPIPGVPIETLPFEEAVQFLTTQIPLGKKSYYALDDKLRLRAFTVGRLNDCDAINKVKGIIKKGLEEGGTIRDFYTMTDAELLDGMGFGKGNMSYWETVYRTNTNTIQNSGRAMAFEEVPPIALELAGVVDARQTDICRSLTQTPFIRKYDDPVWKSLWPPFHFNCRTTVRAIYDPKELDEYGGADAAYRMGEPVKPEKGFGGYPLSKESYWRLTPEMIERAREYGIDGEIAVAAHRLGMKSYAMELVKGYKEIYVSSSGGYVKKALNSTHSAGEVDFAKVAADDGHQIYLLPERTSAKNPDFIIDGEIGDMKQLTSSNPKRIDDAVKDTGHKGATVVLLRVPSAVSKEDILYQVKDRMRHSIVKKAIVHWNGTFFTVQ